MSDQFFCLKEGVLEQLPQRKISANPKTSSSLKTNHNPNQRQFSSGAIVRIPRKASCLVSLAQISILCAIYCRIYALKSLESGLKNGLSLGFPDILAYTAPDLYTILASKLKLKLSIWREFYRWIGKLRIF